MHSSQSTVEIYEKNGSTSIGKSIEPFFPLIRCLFASAHLLRGGGGSNSGDGWLRERRCEVMFQNCREPAVGGWRNSRYWLRSRDPTSGQLVNDVPAKIGSGQSEGKQMSPGPGWVPGCDVMVSVVGKAGTKGLRRPMALISRSTATKLTPPASTAPCRGVNGQKKPA